MASKGVNKVILVGNLGKDPEVRYTPNGKAVANLTLATSESWKDQSGQIQEKTEWHRVSIFGKLAEIAGEYLRKGSQVRAHELLVSCYQDANLGRRRRCLLRRQGSSRGPCVPRRRTGMQHCISR